jgi:hypothetical protein
VDAVARSYIQIQAPRKYEFSLTSQRSRGQFSALGDVQYHWQFVVGTGSTYLMGLSDKSADRVEACLCAEDRKLDARPYVTNAEKS